LRVEKQVCGLARYSMQIARCREHPLERKPFGASQAERNVAGVGCAREQLGFTSEATFYTGLERNSGWFQPLDGAGSGIVESDA
jgi:hypothetical protein